MAFTAQDVKTLREITGCGMMEYKKALTEADGDQDKAIELLRERGLAAAAKKASRIAAEGVVKAYVDEAKKVGIELFVLDDGWFGNRFDDNRALGDWVVNEEKLGGSLESLISAIHDRGLQFGLWLEPEMISVDSDLYRKHPDWAIQVPGYEHTYSRNQLVLNLANPQVVEYLKNVLDELLFHHKIDYIKWDMNRNITNLGNGSYPI